MIFKALNKNSKDWMYSDWKYGMVAFWDAIQNDFAKEFSPVVIGTGLNDKNDKEIFLGDMVEIKSFGDKYKGLYGEVKQLEGGQFYIDHENVSLKYKHQIHCEVCDTESPVFFLQNFDSYELEIVGSELEK